MLSTEKVLVNNKFPNILSETVNVAVGTTPPVEIWITPSYAPTLRRLAGIWAPYVMVPVAETGIVWEANTFTGWITLGSPEVAYGTAGTPAKAVVIALVVGLICTVWLLIGIPTCVYAQGFLEVSTIQVSANVKPERTLLIPPLVNKLVTSVWGSAALFKLGLG